VALFFSLRGYPFGGGGTFAGTAGGSPSAGAKKFGPPAFPGPTCGGEEMVRGAEGVIDGGATAGATVGAAVTCGAVVTSGGVVSRGAGAVLAGRVAGAFRTGEGGWAGTSNRSRQA